MKAVEIKTDLNVSLLQQCYVMDQNGVRAFERGDEIIWFCGRTRSLRERQTGSPHVLLPAR